ncbi:hypothetical protein SAMN05877753_1182 [Bacillus oleivorans]|uniref:Uncharacterized protein n=1 Tax=Bacillus oleivorans TaxID=1448271 RepID=A0A285D7I4_9BACI|nr:hypothetical protein SAMN05877753_1182 [Bacillus oleivorans]
MILTLLQTLTCLSAIPPAIDDREQQIDFVEFSNPSP